ncbi:MAG: exodeoxyribonuclease VII large subunit [Bacteroidetes bacterium]|nr:exodeoxyribonuclease VII large subunit [Bacteroidota bacterium]
MPELINNRKVFTLSEVANSIRNTLAARYGSRFWVRAEMSKLNRYAHSGHCYPDLIERTEGRVVAQMRGIIWATDFQRINANFVQTTGEHLTDGMRIVLEASISFDPNHGLSLIINDIDPSFTLGELELEKRRCIARLKSEGIYELNRQLPMPFFPKRLAIISVSTSKGYADFIALLRARSKGFAINHMLFPAILQGEKAVEQIRAQLDRIRRLKQHFDMVAIIRGGGGDTGLSAFNHYRLASAVATFPLPVMTGIGHATNLTVTEMVAHTRGITPSELADILLERFEYLKASLDYAAKVIGTTPQLIDLQRAELYKATQKLSLQTRKLVELNHSQLNHHFMLLRRNAIMQLAQRKQSLAASANLLLKMSPVSIQQSKVKLSHLKMRLSLASGSLLGISRHRLDSLSQSLSLVDPERVLQRGFSITRMNGRALTDTKGLRTGELIETRLAKGLIISIIKETKHT